MLRDPAEMHAVRMTGKVKYEIPPLRGCCAIRLRRSEWQSTAVILRAFFARRISGWGILKARSFASAQD